MVRDVRGIPPAPRRVRWRRVLGYRWPLAALAFALAVWGGVLTWMLFLAQGGKASDDRRLDAARQLDRLDRARGTVDAVTADSGFIDAATPAELVTYQFEQSGLQMKGHSFAPQGRFAVGAEVEVEMLRGEPSVNRIVGLTTHLIPGVFDPMSWLVAVVVPGLLLGLLYFAGVFHLRHILAHGDVSVAQVLSVQRVRFCLPETWSVRFSFRDHHAHERTSRHWVRAHSNLGNRLRTMARHGTFERLPVLHDRRFPQHCRLVLPDDFAPDAHPVDPAATIRL
jgi:hypothetical protein